MTKQEALDLLGQYLPPDRLSQVLQALASDVQSVQDGKAAASQEYMLIWHPSETYIARLAYGDNIPLWGSERLEHRSSS